MDTGFHHQQTFSLNQQAISFQSSSRGSKSEMIMMGDFNGMNGSAGNMLFSGNSHSGTLNSNSAFTGAGTSCDSLVIDSVPPELKHRGSLAVEWSVEEQYKLEEALPQYANEPGVIRYVKIAATLRNKTVRDVALRVRWLARKRRKHEELNLGKKLKDKKDKLVESTSKPSIPSISTFNVAPFSVLMNNHVQGDGIHVEALQGSIRHLLEQNNQVLGQISTNICALKLQDNVDLFSHMKNNITTILNDMRYIPGPPLPVSLNEDLANSILHAKSQSQTMMFNSSSGMHMKQEPGCW